VTIYAEQNYDCLIWESDSMRTMEELEMLWMRSSHTPETYIGALYHPPKPLFDADELLDSLEQNIDMIKSSNPDALIILGDDLNHLDPEKSMSGRKLCP
jgi:hypothetical protein